MKLASFQGYDSRPAWGKVDGDTVIDFSEHAPSLRAYLADPARPDSGTLSGPASALSAVRLLPVVPDAGKILCVGHNYESHRAETGRAKVSYPSIFLRFADTLIGAEAPIVRPTESTDLDFEGELAVVIGRGGRRIDPMHALDHVAGYSCFNDASVRDWQWHTTQFAPGKNFPATGAFGPWLVTADEVPDPSALSVTTRLNGTVVQDQPTADMIFDIPTVIAYISTFTTLNPGDVICTGTPGGVGAKRQPPLWMKPGDVVEVDIPTIGLLRNSVGAEG